MSRSPCSPPSACVRDPVLIIEKVRARLSVELGYERQGTARRGSHRRPCNTLAREMWSNAPTPSTVQAGLAATEEGGLHPGRRRSHAPKPTQRCPGTHARPQQRLRWNWSSRRRLRARPGNPQLSGRLGHFAGRPRRCLRKARRGPGCSCPSCWTRPVSSKRPRPPRGAATPRWAHTGKTWLAHLRSSPAVTLGHARAAVVLHQALRNPETPRKTSSAEGGGDSRREARHDCWEEARPRRPGTTHTVSVGMAVSQAPA